MLGINTDTNAQEDKNNNEEKGEIHLIYTNNNESLLSVQQIKKNLKENYQGTLKKIVEYIFCDDNKKKLKHELIAAFLESCQEKDLTNIIFDMVKEIVFQPTVVADNNNNNIQVQSFHVLYSFFETSFLFIDQQHRNIISYLSPLEKKVIKFRALYLLLLQLSKVFKNFCLQNISQTVLINYIAISAYYGVVEDESLAKKILINALSVHEKQNRYLFDEIIKKINEFQIIDLKFVALKLQLIASFIEHSLQNNYILSAKEVKKWLREDDFIKIKIDAKQNKDILNKLYENAVTIHHVCTNATDDKPKINSPKIERRVKSEENLASKKITTKPKIPTFTTLSMWGTPEKPPLEEFIEQLRSYSTTPLFSIRNNSLKEFFNSANNIEDRIKIVMELIVKTDDQELKNNLLEYLSIVLGSSFKRLNERLFGWLQRLKELGFDYQPYYSEYITNTFVEIEKLNLLRVINDSTIAISYPIIMALQNARESWYVEGDEKYKSLLNPLFLQMQIEIPTNKDIYTEILYLSKVEKSDCLRIKREKLQQVFDENKVAKMEPERFVLEFLLITFKKIENNYKPDHNLTPEEIEKDFFVIYWDDLSFECQIRLIDYVSKTKLYPARSSTVRKVNNRLQKLVEDKKVEFKRKILTALENESEYRLVTYYDNYNLDISSEEITQYQRTQFFLDPERKLVPTIVSLQQVFVNKHNQLVWLKIVNEQLIVEPVNTNEHTSHDKLRFCLFTISLFGRLFLLSHNKNFKKQEIHHSAIGEPLIIGGGEANIHNSILDLTFYTGHFWDYAAACERIVSLLERYYSVNMSCLVYMRNEEKISEELDKSFGTLQLRDIQQSLKFTHALTLKEFKNLIRNPVSKFQIGIKRCIDIFRFFLKAISNEEMLIIFDALQNITNVPITNKLEELINELNNLKVKDEGDTTKNLEAITDKYNFRPDRDNFWIDYLYKTLKDLRKNLRCLDYVVYKPENLISRSNLISVLYDYLYSVINELKTKFNYGFTSEVEELIQKNEFDEVYHHFINKLENNNNPELKTLLAELEINPIVTFNKIESLKVQAFRVALCASLYRFKESRSQKNYEQEFYKILDLPKSDITIKDFLTIINKILSDRGEKSIRSYLNVCLKPVKTFIGFDVVVTEGTDILARLIDEFSYDSSLGQETPATLSTSPVSALTLG